MRLRCGPFAPAGAGTTKRRRALRIVQRWCLCVAMSWLVAAPVFAMRADPALASQASIELDGTPRDPDFGVGTRHSGLQRHVEMYQWTRAGDSYARAWRGARVDSSGFAPEHDNPNAMPLREREWHAAVSLDGRRVPDAIITELGKWQTFRPDFSALPGNMSATFQPEGDRLGSADNPLAPRVGDLRVTWRAFVLPPLAGRLALKDGAWTLRATPATPAAANANPQADALPQARRSSNWLFFSGAFVVLLAAVAAGMRRRRRKQAG